MTAQPPTFAGMQSEREFADSVVEAAELLGWLVKRDPAWRPTAASPGFPDCVLCNGRRVIFAELKAKTGKLSEPQKLWIALLKSAGADVRIWFPADWPEIEATLKGEA